jgi:hypothetical protein
MRELEQHYVDGHYHARVRGLLYSGGHVHYAEDKDVRDRDVNLKGPLLATGRVREYIYVRVLVDHQGSRAPTITRRTEESPLMHQTMFRNIE